MQPDFEYLSISVFYAALITGLLVALWKGGQPEKFGVLVLVAITVIQLSASALFPPRFDDVDPVALLTDTIALIGFGWIAIHARRVWPIWAAAFQLLSVASHFARYVQLGIEPMVYSILKSGPTGLAIILLIVGTLLHRRRVLKYGKDPSWMDWNTQGQVRWTS